MRFNRPLPETQALSQATALTSPAVPVATNGRAQALAAARKLEGMAGAIGTSPWWLSRWLSQRNLSIDAFLAGADFKALQQKRSASEARAHALLREGPPPDHPQRQTPPPNIDRRRPGWRHAAKAPLKSQENSASQPAQEDGRRQPKQPAATEGPAPSPHTPQVRHPARTRVWRANVERAVPDRAHMVLTSPPPQQREHAHA